MNKPVYFDWNTWNRSLITADLEDIREEVVHTTSNNDGSIIVEEITLEL